MTLRSGERWVVVIPVKPATRGKSRLEAPGIDRVALARALALDTIAAAAACDAVERVVVVGDDGGLVMLASDIPGLRFVPEGDSRGLNEAIATGLGLEGAAGSSGRFDGMPRAALLGDLPALRTGDLSTALEVAASVDRAVVADADGTGSTLVTARPRVPWLSAFGDGSFARHVGLGFAPLPIPESSTLRHDVDTADQLRAARALGLGPRTAALVAAALPPFG